MDVDGRSQVEAQAAADALNHRPLPGQLPVLLLLLLRERVVLALLMQRPAAGFWSATRRPRYPRYQRRSSPAVS